MMNDSISFLPIGGVGDVTKNMYVYTYGDQMFIIDCGLGFADETMLGVDLLLPDISYILSSLSLKKNIVGMVLTHGHEDHIGALPFILPQIPVSFPIYATPLTAALANEKLEEFGLEKQVQAVQFEDNKVQLGDFSASFIRVTHSVPDSANIFIQTPVGNFYHGSDFKFDFTPADKKQSEFSKIAKAKEAGVLCLMSDCLGAERAGYSQSEEALSENFEREMRRCKGKFIMTTYSSNISRLNQAIAVGKMCGRKVCFVGRSLIKAKEVAQRLGYINIAHGAEIEVDQIRNHKDSELLFLVAGSQGQENSAMSRIANGEHKEIKIAALDVVVFSADPIPGNEVAVNTLIDTLAKTGARVVYSQISDDFHVSGHGSSQDLLLMMSLVSSKLLLPISGTFRQMIAYKRLALKLGYKEQDIFLVEDGQEIIFEKQTARLGKKIAVRNVFVDETSGEEVEGFVLRDRKQLSEGGIIIVMVEVDSATGQMVGTSDIIIRGFPQQDEKSITPLLQQEVRRVFAEKKGRVTNWVHIRRQISDFTERCVFKKLRRRPLILPIVIEV